MEPLQILLWLLCFGVFLFLQAIFINGIKTSMDGSTEMLPNGKSKDSEMIFYPFLKYITQLAEPKRIYYEGKYFIELIEMFFSIYGKEMPDTTELEIKGSYIELKNDAAVEKMHIAAWKIMSEQKIGTDFDVRHIRFFKEYEYYRFSKWVRKPLGQCIKCMASAHSVIPFWGTVLPVFGFQWFLVPLYLVNVVSLAYVNYLIFKR